MQYTGTDESSKKQSYICELYDWIAVLTVVFYFIENHNNKSKLKQKRQKYMDYDIKTFLVPYLEISLLQLNLLFFLYFLGVLVNIFVFLLLPFSI